RKYYHYGANGNWTFQAQDGLRLLAHAETPIKRHIKVKGDKSSFDGDWAYWSKRGINKVGLPTKLTRLLKEQKGKCNECGLF
ncbi:group II intron reverse transcriptase/maturase, partial [Phormidium sp. CCY1219]|nr:group II intron reverse transcriptase/maturase [Phormidium sp. CCY1219]